MSPTRLDLGAETAVHVVGCGGAGMAPITALLHAMGHRVTGSDHVESAATVALGNLGVAVTIGADYGAIPATAAIVRSTAVPDSHPEISAALSAGRQVLSRADALAGITDQFQTVAVAGTHGKTTTSSMTAAALLGAGTDVSTVIGGRLIGVDQAVSGAVLGTSAGVLVVEADESDGTFVELAADIAVVTNIEPDHLEFYGGEQNLYAAFDRFIGRDSLQGVVACIDDPGVQAALARRGTENTGLSGHDDSAPVITYGTSSQAAVRLHFTDSDSRIEIAGRSYPVSPRQPGLHNALNVTAALAVVHAIDGNLAQAASALTKFGGVGRRFEVRGTVAGITVVDDYAHLGGEITAAISAARGVVKNQAISSQLSSPGSVVPGRVVVVFQPHRYSRIEALWDTYAPALAAADVVLLTDIYPSGETARPGITADLIGNQLAELSPDLPVIRIGGAATVAEALASVAEPGDICLMLSAGDLPLVAADSLAAILGEQLRRALPAKVEVGGSVGELCTYRVGGAALAIVTVDSVSDLERIRALLPGSIPVMGVGAGSNLLVSDAGFPGIVVKLGQSFTSVGDYRGADLTADAAGDLVDPILVSVGGAAMLPRVARQLAKDGIAGFNWAVGVPGTIGGAVKMNAGGHGSDMAASIRSASVYNLRTGGPRDVPAADLGLSYRRSALQADDIVLSVDLSLHRSHSKTGDKLIDGGGIDELREIVQWRRSNQPGGQNAGSVFANPPGDSAGRMIEACGLKGFSVGTAHVSDKHANFIQAGPDGSADDVFAVIKAVRAAVKKRFGVTLRVENQLVGFPALGSLDDQEGPAGPAASKRGTFEPSPEPEIRRPGNDR